MYEQRAAAAAGRGVMASAMPPPPSNAKENARTARCMWCSFSCARSGELLEHFRSSHPHEYCANEERFKKAMRDKLVGSSAPTTAAADAARSEQQQQQFGGGRRGSSSGIAAADGDKAAVASADCGPWRATSGGTACPHCHVDCLTRKKLMSHIEAAHKPADDDDADDDDDGEPPVKVIRLKRSGGGDLIESLSAAGVERISPALGKLLKAIRPEDMGVAGRATAASNASIPAAAVAAAFSAAAGVQGKSRGGSATGASGPGGMQQQAPNCFVSGGGMAAGSGLMGDVRVLTLPSGSLARVTDKKYKCFWCNALFRKRGKLMDHIDLFHKDSKQQTEVEAEMLNSAAAAARKDTAPATAAASSDSKCGPGMEATQQQHRQAAAMHGGGDVDGDCHAPSSVWRGGAAAAVSAATQQQQQRPQVAVVPARPPCRFVYRAPVHRLKPDDTAGEPAADDGRGCKFYFGKSTNPLTAGRPPVLTGAAAPAGMQWPVPAPQSTFPPTCYFYAGCGSVAPAAAVHHQYKPAASTPVPAALELPYLLLCGAGGSSGSAGNVAGGRSIMPYHEDDGGSRARLPIMPSPTEAAVLSQHYAVAAAAAAARFRAAEEYPLDLSSRLK